MTVQITDCVLFKPALSRPKAVPVQGASNSAFTVSWACSAAEVREAQRLRYLVFAHEMGAQLETLPGMAEPIDADRFDPYCDHLLVRAAASGHGRGQVIGTYRVLGPRAARRAGGLYAETEFDLAPLAGLRARAVELGRSCVHPAWRTGGVIMALWTALGQYMIKHELETMVGCASISLSDGGDTARRLWQRLSRTHLAEPRWQVEPYVPLALFEHDAAGPATTLVTPPLIKGYLRCGALLLGPPALDAAFNTADLPMMMRIGDLAPRYGNHFLA